MTLGITFLLITLVVGTIMGLLGGGGSILLVPLLTYVGHLDPKVAIPTSLIVVMSGAAISTLLYQREKRVRWKEGLTLAIFAMSASYLGGRLAAYFSGPVLLILFATLMFISSLFMFFRRTPTNEEEKEGAENEQKEEGATTWKILLKTAFIGTGIGVVTGLVGAGGGFIIVPVLVLVMGLDMKQAVATSLLVITLNSGAAVLGHLSEVSLSWQQTLEITGAMVAGSITGTFLSKKIDSSQLKKAFACLIFIISVSIYIAEIPPFLSSL